MVDEPNPAVVPITSEAKAARKNKRFIVKVYHKNSESRFLRQKKAGAEQIYPDLFLLRNEMEDEDFAFIGNWCHGYHSVYLFFILSYPCCWQCRSDKFS